MADTQSTSIPDADLRLSSAEHMFHPKRRDMAPVVRSFSITALACGLTTVLATPLIGHVDLANILMLFLLTVVGVGATLGRGPALAAAFLSVALFDFFFVPPRFSFTVEDPQYLMTFAVMLVVASIIGHLTADLKRQADEALVKERRSHALYEMARGLAGAVSMNDVIGSSERFLHDAIDVTTVFLIAGPGGHLEVAGNPAFPRRLVIAPLLARFAYENDACTDLDAQYPVGYFPLKAPGGVRGVLAVESPRESTSPLYENQEFLQTAASLIAIALERTQLAQRSAG
jgi:two-component system sensor histidine kinase KdpD